LLFRRGLFRIGEDGAVEQSSEAQTRLLNKEVQAVRMKLKASQALLATSMGVNKNTVSSWEQGRRNVPPMARRYLDDLVDIPVLWATRTGSGVKVR